jgi:DAACS family dicarboxylate/amino acid:cation (Na+ or H+) symporter
MGPGVERGHSDDNATFERGEVKDVGVVVAGPEDLLRRLGPQHPAAQRAHLGDGDDSHLGHGPVRCYDAADLSAHIKILLGMVVGSALGLAARWLPPSWIDFAANEVARPIGQVFLRLLFMLIIPLLFGAVVSGVAALELKRLGRIGARTLAYATVVSGIAVVIGLVLVNTFQPGAGMPPELLELAKQQASVTALPRPPDAGAVALIVAMVPDNPIKAAAGGDMIAVIIFSLLFGIALSFTESDAARTLKTSIEGLSDVMTTMVHGVLKLAPLGVAALLFTLTAKLGVELFWHLGKYVLVVLLALALHQFVVYSLLVKFLGGRSPLQFFKDIRLAMLTAFATASSSATLPTALKVAEENLKLPAPISRFVLTAGSAMNQNGTALFEGVTVLFLAQLYGVELATGQQVSIMVICILGGIGTAGVPAGSLPVIAMILSMFGIPPEGLGLVIGVDRLLDMSRTTLNVTGDLAAAVYVARAEEQRGAS